MVAPGGGKHKEVMERGVIRFAYVSIFNIDISVGRTEYSR